VSFFFIFSTCSPGYTESFYLLPPTLRIRLPFFDLRSQFPSLEGNTLHPPKKRGFTGKCPLRLKESRLFLGPPRKYTVIEDSVPLFPSSSPSPLFPLTCCQVTAHPFTELILYSALHRNTSCGARNVVGLPARRAGFLVCEPLGVSFPPRPPARPIFRTSPSHAIPFFFEFRNWAFFHFPRGQRRSPCPLDPLTRMSIFFHQAVNVFPELLLRPMPDAKRVLFFTCKLLWPLPTEMFSPFSHLCMVTLSP